MFGHLKLRRYSRGITPIRSVSTLAKITSTSPYRDARSQEILIRLFGIRWLVTVMAYIIDTNCSNRWGIDTRWNRG